MKFQQLKIGQAFEYQGDSYVKSSPLVASHAETGKQKLIPRYAAIVTTESSLNPDDKNPPGISTPNKSRSPLTSFMVVIWIG